MSNPMPVLTIKAKDNLALAAVEQYRYLCEINGLDEQAAEVEKAIAEIEQWRAANPDQLQMPDHTHVPVAAEPTTRTAITAALRDMADRIGRGPTFPLPPSVISALVRERADDIAAEEASRP